MAPTGRPGPARPAQTLSFRLLTRLVAITVVVAAVNLYWNISRETLQAYRDLHARARLISVQFLSVRSWVAQQPGAAIPGEKYTHLDPEAVAAGLRTVFADDPGVALREVWVRASDELHAPDPLEEEAIRRFTTDPTLVEFSVLERAGGVSRFRYLIPIQMEEACLTCHRPSNGAAADEAREQNQAAGGTAALDSGTAALLPPEFNLGEVAGAISLAIPTRALDARLQSQFLVSLGFTVALVAMLFAAVYATMAQLVTRPLAGLGAWCRRIASGDLARHPRLQPAPREIADLAREFQVMAQRLHDLYQHLEDKVAQRTAELSEANRRLQLSQQELRRAYEEVSEANRLKSDFLATTSHELRTPLTSIIASTELLLEEAPGGLSDRQREYLQGILDSSYQLLGSINSLLDMAKVEAGRMEFRPSLFRLEILVEAVARRMEARAVRKGISFRVALDGPLPALTADYRKIEQVLFNLVDNAIKFTPAGGTVTVGARYQPDSGRVQLHVQDTGIGIAPEEHERIFESFWQAGSASTREHRGTGLGLALVKRLVEMHGGSVGVTSAPGKGSTFTVSLPVVTPAAASRPGSERRNRREGSEPP